MDFFATLWLPILLSAVFVFVASSVLHMLLPLHRNDYQKLPKEAELLAAMRENSLEPGTYMFPCPSSMKDMSSPEMEARYRAGPVGFMTVFPNGTPAVAKSLLQWFLYSLLISLFVGYIAGIAAEPGEPSLAVFRLTGTVAILGYALADLPSSIWKGQKWSTTAKFLLDGILYGLVTAGTFAWLWPAA